MHAKTSSRRNTVSIVVVAIVFVIAAGAFIRPLFAADLPGPIVEVARVEVAPMADEVTAVGSLRSNESVILRPEIAGRVNGIAFAEGSDVAAGAPLFTLDDSIARAELAQADARLRLSRRNYDRVTELASKGTASPRAVDEARSTLETDEAAVTLAKVRLDKTRISAPFAGIVGLRRVSVGDYVLIGQDLVNLESIDPIKVDFRVPERYLAATSPGQRLLVEVDAFPGRTFEGQVFALDPLVDAAGRSLAVRAILPNNDRALRPGLFARIRLVMEQRQQAVIVPEQALVPRGGERFVYRVVDGKAMLSKVEVGLRRPGRVEILSGLAPGDVIVTAGQLKLRDGMTVTIANPQQVGS